LRGVRDDERPAHFADAAVRRLHVLAVAVHVTAVREADRLQVAGIRIGAVGRRLDRNLRAGRE
jgi:hypothetical protein